MLLFAICHRRGCIHLDGGRDHSVWNEETQVRKKTTENRTVSVCNLQKVGTRTRNCFAKGFSQSMIRKDQQELHFDNNHSMFCSPETVVTALCSALEEKPVPQNSQGGDVARHLPVTVSHGLALVISTVAFKQVSRLVFRCENMPSIGL